MQQYADVEGQVMTQPMTQRNRAEPSVEAAESTGAEPSIKSKGQAPGKIVLKLERQTVVDWLRIVTETLIRFPRET
jgi:hypothetical protein